MAALMQLLSRIILYPLCLVVGIWCTRNFTEGYNEKKSEVSSAYEVQDESPAENPLSDAENGGGPSPEIDPSSPEINVASESDLVVSGAEPDALDAVSEVGAPSHATDKKPMMPYFGGMLVCLIVLALLLGRDVSILIASRAGGGYFARQSTSSFLKEYEVAEDVLMNGDYVAGIEMMRDCLKKYPHETHVHTRIAEIYENELGNHLAAALEYEELLAKKLSPTRWGWAAIHLCKLYSGKLNQPDRAIELLRQVDEKCGQTSPAKKARERLGMIDETGQ